MSAKECKCSMSIRVLGDGCEVCNPAQALEYAKGAIEDLQCDLDTLRLEVRKLINPPPDGQPAPEDEVLPRALADRVLSDVREINRLRGVLAEQSRLIEEQRRLLSSDTVTVRYDLAPAAVEGELRAKLIELGWVPPGSDVEPFGYFKAEPFGWTDCAETDEGAKALYERPAAQRFDDRFIADTVNTLRDIAINFHGLPQLRARISHVVVPLLKQPAPDVAAMQARIAELERVQDMLVLALKRYQVSESLEQLRDAAIRAESALAAVQKQEGGE